MNTKISQLPLAGSLGTTDKLEISTSTPVSQAITGQMIVNLINSLLTLHQVVINGGSLNFSDVINNTNNTVQLQFADGQFLLYGQDTCSLQTSNAGNLVLDSPAVNLPELGVPSGKYGIVGIDNTGGYAATSSLGYLQELVFAANDGAAAGLGVVLHGVYFNTGSGQLITRTV